jgi:hypothetical protein
MKLRGKARQRERARRRAAEQQKFVQRQCLRDRRQAMLRDRPRRAMPVQKPLRRSAGW